LDWGWKGVQRSSRSGRMRGSADDIKKLMGTTGVGKDGGGIHEKRPDKGSSSWRSGGKTLIATVMPNVTGA